MGELGLGEKVEQESLLDENSNYLVSITPTPLLGVYEIGVYRREKAGFKGEGICHRLVGNKFDVTTGGSREIFFEAAKAKINRRIFRY